MPLRRVRVAGAGPLAAGLAAVRAEAQLPAGFPEDVLAEAAAAAGTRPAAPRVELPFVTVDPPGARDLDQALHIERRGDGHRVSYAIADVAAFVRPGGAIDRAAHARGVTVYLPGEKVPLHPPQLSEGPASLLPGQWTPAVVWTVDLDGAGAAVATTVVRAEVRSAAQHTYADVPPQLAPLLREVGERRSALERARGGVQLNVPEQEVVQAADGSWRTRYRVGLLSEADNAQISLLVGMEAAKLMLAAGTGILRTQPAPDDRDYARLRRQAEALGVAWPPGEPYPELVRRLDPAVPAEAALAQQATGLAHGAGYTVFDGAPPPDAEHFAVAAHYAHATAPLRRLQDRFVSECCLAASTGSGVPDWVRGGLEALPAVMAAGTRRANAVERQVVDLAEALLLQGREGERFDAVVIDDGLVQLADLAVRAKLAEGEPAVGSRVQLRLVRADPAAREVRFALVP